MFLRGEPSPAHATVAPPQCAIRGLPSSTVQQGPRYEQEKLIFGIAEPACWGFRG